MECPSCRGRLHIVESIRETDSVRQILERIGLPTDIPRPVRARDPTTVEGDLSDASS